MGKITVILAEDHMIVREGLGRLLSIEDDIEVIGETQTGRETVEMAKKLRPDVVVMDIAMPLLNGIEATRAIHNVLAHIKILILSAHSDCAYVEKAIAHGASGYLIKQTSSHILSKAIREVHKGNQFFSPSILKQFNHNKKVLSGTRQDKSSTPPGANLTVREMQVIQLIAEGQPNKQIASELSISIKTVEKHRQNLMQKLDIHDTAGLTRHAIDTGIIESSTQNTTE